MTVFCITQARMNSSRLPGKIFKTINSIPLLEFHINRVKRSQLIDQHIIATTDSLIDKIVQSYCEAHNIHYYRGSEYNVLQRYYQTAKHFGASENDLIVRLTSDCPLICPELIDEVIRSHQQKPLIHYSRADLDYIPRGFDVEVFSMQALSEAFENAESSFQKEHVTPYLYQGKFSRLTQLVRTGKRNWSKLRLCVDEQRDFELIEQLVLHFPENWLEIKAEEICQLLLDNPELLAINGAVVQK